jgi:hypothetical protein
MPDPIQKSIVPRGVSWKIRVHALAASSNDFN